MIHWRDIDFFFVISVSFKKKPKNFQDRRRVYSILESVGIEIPRYGVLDRDSPDPKREYYVHFIDWL